MRDGHITYMSTAASVLPKPQLQEPAAGSHPTGKIRVRVTDADTAWSGHSDMSHWHSESYPRSPGACCLCKPADILDSSLTSDRVNAMATGARDYRSAPSPMHCNGMAETSQRREI